MTIHLERKFSAGNKRLLGLGWGRGTLEESQWTCTYRKLSVIAVRALLNKAVTF